MFLLLNFYKFPFSYDRWCRGSISKFLISFVRRRCISILVKSSKQCVMFCYVMFFCYAMLCYVFNFFGRRRCISIFVNCSKQCVKFCYVMLFICYVMLCYVFNFFRYKKMHFHPCELLQAVCYVKNRLKLRHNSSQTLKIQKVNLAIWPFWCCPQEPYVPRNEQAQKKLSIPTKRRSWRLNNGIFLWKFFLLWTCNVYDANDDSDFEINDDIDANDDVNDAKNDANNDANDDANDDENDEKDANNDAEMMRESGNKRTLSSSLLSVKVIIIRPSHNSKSS